MVYTSVANRFSTLPFPKCRRSYGCHPAAVVVMLCASNRPLFSDCCRVSGDGSRREGRDGWMGGGVHAGLNHVTPVAPSVVYLTDR